MHAHAHRLNFILQHIKLNYITVYYILLLYLQTTAVLSVVCDHIRLPKKNVLGYDATIINICIVYEGLASKDKVSVLI